MVFLAEGATKPSKSELLIFSSYDIDSEHQAAQIVIPRSDAMADHPAYDLRMGLLTGRISKNKRVRIPGVLLTSKGSTFTTETRFAVTVAFELAIVVKKMTIIKENGSAFLEFVPNPDHGLWRINDETLMYSTLAYQHTRTLEDVVFNSSRNKERFFLSKTLMFGGVKEPSR